MTKRLISVLILLGMGITWIGRGSSFAELTPQPKQLVEVKIEQRLDQQLPLDAEFRDENNAPVLLGDYFGKKPVVLVFVYYECPMLCTLVLNGLTRALKAMKFTAGNEFEIVTISFDPTEDAVFGAQKKEVYLKEYGRPEAAKGWHFLTGPETSIKRVTDAAGFYYDLDVESGEYAHASAIMVVTPTGHLARYMFGIEYSTKDLQFAIIESSHNRIGSLVDQILLYCFHYDPSTGKYSLAVINVLRMIGALLVFGLLAFIGISLKMERKK